MFSPGLIEALGQIITGLQGIGDGLTVLISFILEYMGISASAEFIQMATILILLSVVWKVGSKLTSSIFLFLIASQAMSFLGAV